MQTYRCQCGNRLYFHNTLCTACGAEVGWCDSCRRVGTIEAEKDSLRHVDCNLHVRACTNRASEICNCYVEAKSDSELCRSCQTTSVIPDLNDPTNQLRWQALERAKRRLLYELTALKLPFDAQGGAEYPVSFEFKADQGDEKVITGHADGVVTINLAEADPVHREMIRTQFGEPQRTLIGHFRHEIGHYYWFTHVDPQRLDAAVKLFGDPLAVAYGEALPAYYQNGPQADWQTNFISAYASAHPWEDFAETFGFYLDMQAVLATVAHQMPQMAPKNPSGDVTKLLARYSEFGLIANEINRTMGLTDLVPEVVPPAIVPKLQFIHSLRGQLK